MRYFHFTRGERRGLIASTLVLLGALFYLASRHQEPLEMVWVVRETVPSVREHQPGKRDRSMVPVAKDPAIQPPEPPPAREKQPVLPPVPFDPNVADMASLRRAGMPERVARTILRYREKGGRFYRKEDLKKIYTMTDSLYAAIEPYLVVESTVRLHEEKRYARIDVNQADAETCKLLPGIGSGYAARICRFRDVLGGFLSVSQVAETRGLPDSVYRRIEPLLDISPVLRKLPVNRLSADSLALHPYISAKQARLLVRYRTHHGPYHSTEDVEKCKSFTREELEKVSPYFDFDPG
ncbi:MAG: helix-hairpin-helix domain-containing protein [Saprospiraceae bacterium]|nr:helix-hairpin-helix domain-containing protein [Saprospiraceae bacterium]